MTSFFALHEKLIQFFTLLHAHWCLRADALGTKNTSNSQSTYFVPTLQSTFCIQSAVCIRSAVCTNRYPWHQYSLFLVTIIRTKHTIYHKTHVWVNSVFSFFFALILFFPFEQCRHHLKSSSNPPTPKKLHLHRNVENISSRRNSLGLGPHICQQNKHIPLKLIGGLTLDPQVHFKCT